MKYDSLHECKPLAEGAVASQLNSSVPEGKSIHQWFELTYAQFLTVPRVIMEAMPLDWQYRMTALLDEMDEQWNWLPAEGRSYLVKVYKTLEHPWENDEGEEKIQEFEIDADLCNYRHPRIEHRRKLPDESRKGFWDVYEPNSKTIYVTVFNSLEAESYAKHGFRVVEQTEAKTD